MRQVLALLVGAVLSLAGIAAGQQASSWRPPKMHELKARERTIETASRQTSKPAEFIASLRKQMGEHDWKSNEGDIPFEQARAGFFQFQGRRWLVVQAVGDEYCGATGNCDFWLFEVKNDRPKLTLHEEMVQTFAFQDGRKPQLVLGSHASATESVMQVHEYKNGGFPSFRCFDVKYLNRSGTALRTQLVSCDE